MKLSEKIQEALREQQEINLSDPAVQKRLAAQWGYVPVGAQPAPSVPEGVSFIDTSQLEGVVSTEIVHSYPPPSGWLRAIDEALVVTHLGVANGSDTYEQAKAKLDNLIGFHVDVATDPAVNGGYRLVPIELTHEKEPTMQDALMKFDPATGEERPYPSHATQWRNWHGIAAWLFDPWTGRRRNAYDVGSDVHGLLIAPAGTLGMDMGGGCAEKNNVAGAQPTPEAKP